MATQPLPRRGTGLLPPKLAGQRTTHNAQRTPATVHSCTNALDPLVTVNNKEQGEEQEQETGRTPYFLKGLVRSEQDEREAQDIKPSDYGVKWKATFRYITGDAPKCRPGDRAAARVYWQKVVSAMQKGGWSPAEWHYLYRAQKQWGKRWRGQDARFEVAGTRPGRLCWEDRDRVRTIEMALGLSALARGRR